MQMETNPLFHSVGSDLGYVTENSPSEYSPTDHGDPTASVSEIYTRLWLGCCKLENEILKDAKNLEK